MPFVMSEETSLTAKFFSRTSKVLGYILQNEPSFSLIIVKRIRIELIFGTITQLLDNIELCYLKYACKSL